MPSASRSTTRHHNVFRTVDCNVYRGASIVLDTVKKEITHGSSHTAPVVLRTHRMLR